MGLEVDVFEWKDDKEKHIGGTILYDVPIPRIGETVTLGEDIRYAVIDVRHYLRLDEETTDSYIELVVKKSD